MTYSLRIKVSINKSWSTYVCNLFTVNTMIELIKKWILNFTLLWPLVLSFYSLENSVEKLLFKWVDVFFTDMELLNCLYTFKKVCMYLVTIFKKWKQKFSLYLFRRNSIRWIFKWITFNIWERMPTSLNEVLYVKILSPNNPIVLRRPLPVVLIKRKRLSIII